MLESCYCKYLFKDFTITLENISLGDLQLLNFSVLLSFLEFVLKKLLMNAVSNTKASFGLASHLAS